MKRILCFVLCLAFCAGASACSWHKVSEVYNTDSLIAEFEDYVVFKEQVEHPYLYNKHTAQCEVFFYDPVLELDTVTPFLYYAKELDGRVSMLSGRYSYDIYRVDLDSFHWEADRGILRVGVYDSYLGAEDLFPGLHNANRTMGTFLYGYIPYVGGYIMFRSSGVFLLKGNRRTQEECLKEEDDIFQGNYAFDGRSVYYMTGNRALIALDIQTAQRTVLYEDITDFRLTECEVLLLCGGDIWRLEPDSGKVERLISGAEGLLGYTDEYIYYRNSERLCRANRNGSASEVLPVEGNFYSIGLVSDPQCLFFYGKDGLSRCNYDGTDVTVIQAD